MKKHIQIFFLLLFLIPISFTKILAKEDVVTPTLDSVIKNNFEAKIFDENIIYGKIGDSLRVSGFGTPGDKVVVFFNNQEYSTTVDQYRSWFVLFSIPNTKENLSIEVEARNSNGTSSKVTLVTLKIGDEPTNEENSNSSGNTDFEKKSIKLDFQVVLIVILSITTIILGWFSFSKKILKKSRK